MRLYHACMPYPVSDHRMRAVDESHFEDGTFVGAHLTSARSGLQVGLNSWPLGERSTELICPVTFKPLP